MIVTWWLRQRSRYTHEPTFFEYVRDVNEENSHGPYIRDGRIFWHDVDEHIRYENLEGNLNDYLALFDLPAIELSHENMTVNKDPWQSYYDDRIIAIVREKFGEEAEKFGYDLTYK